MKQVIAQHGWGLDQSFWDIYKNEFQENNWFWQNNERGYFSKNQKQSTWIKNNSENNVKMILCHSLGFKLIQKNTFMEASHIVLINSFNNFIPSNDKRNLVLRSLERMKTKIIKYETKDVLKEFTKRSFLPNDVNANFRDIFYKNLNSINNELLLKDFKKLYINKNLPELINKNFNTLFIQSDNDLILDKDSSKDFLEVLNKILPKKPTVIKLFNQGHCLTNLNLYEIINNYLDN